MMKVGDMVRFAKWEDLKDVNDWSTTAKNRIGILVKHDKILQTTQILYEGELLTVRPQLAEKAGRKDFNKEGN